MSGRLYLPYFGRIVWIHPAVLDKICNVKHKASRGLVPSIKLVGLRRRRTAHQSGGGDLVEMLVYGYAVVVERRRLQDYARGPHQHGQRKNPQEQPVQYHRHVLPVLFYLYKSIFTERSSS